MTLAEAQAVRMNKDLVDRFVTKAQTGDGEDFKADVQLDIYKGESTDPNDGISVRAFKNAKEGDVYTLVFNYDPDYTKPYAAESKTVVTIGEPAEQAPAAPTADEISSLPAVTFGGKAQGIFDAYPIEGTYTAAGAPEKDEAGTWTYELDLAGDAETAARYLEQKGADPSIYVFDAGASDTTIKLAYDAEAKTWKLASPATLAFGYNVPSVDAGNLDLSGDGVRFVDDDSDDKVGAAPLADGTYTLDASQAVPNGGGEWLLYVRLSNLQSYLDAYNAAHPDTFYELAGSDPNAVVVLRSYGQKWTISEPAKIYVKQGEKPQAPAFDLAGKINTYGSVSVRVDGGTGYTDATFTYVPADAVAKLVTEQSEPVRRADGTWEVTVTIDPAVAKGFVNPSIGDGYEFVADGSRVTATFETLSAAGTQWYVKPGAGAELLFKKKAPVAADLHVFGEPGNTTTESYTVSAHVGDKLKDVAGFELAPEKDGWKFDGWFLDKGYTEPATVDTVIATPWFAVYGKWERVNSYELAAKASASYTPEEAKAAFGYTGSYKNGDAAIAKALLTAAKVNGEDLDVAADLTGDDPQLKVTVWNAQGSNGFFDLVSGKEGAYKVDFTLGDKTASAEVTVKAAPVQPTAPAAPTEQEVDQALNQAFHDEQGGQGFKVTVTDGKVSRSYDLVPGTYTVSDPVLAGVHFRSADAGTYESTLTIDLAYYVGLFKKDVGGDYELQGPAKLVYRLAYDAAQKVWSVLDPESAPKPVAKVEITQISTVPGNPVAPQVPVSTKPADKGGKTDAAPKAADKQAAGKKAALPQTGDASLAGIAASVLAGIAALGTGAAFRRRRREE